MIDSSLSMSKEIEVKDDGKFQDRGRTIWESSPDRWTSFPICFFIVSLDSPKNVSEVVRKGRISPRAGASYNLLSI